MTISFQLIPPNEFERVLNSDMEISVKLAVLADMNRFNTLTAVKRAGSGHLGSSLSSLDIVSWLYYSVMNVREVGFNNSNRDIYFSSKGHDVPGLYSVLYSLRVIPEERFMKLRRFGGLDGHPDVRVPGIEANSGSLGMGISKGKGMAWAKRFQGHGGHVFVMTGDGELQEGQNYEALQSASFSKIGNLTVIVDHNKVQSDKKVSKIVDIHDLVKRFEAFGWQVVRCDGHDFNALDASLKELKADTDRPGILIADTLKGRGVSFMEHPQAIKDGKGYYPWHAGAPDDDAYQRAVTEILTRIQHLLQENQQRKPELKTIQFSTTEAGKVVLEGEPTSLAAPKKRAKVSDEYVANAYGKALMELAEEKPEMVVLDGDLAADCRIREFELAYPDRFIEVGIAEQDMVSMAGGLARMGLLPVVNSFASFLASRSNEQVYNNASEKTKIIYANHYAGLIPAGPGKSHQSIRDIALMASIPNMIVIQPCNAVETKMALNYCVKQASENCALRLVIGPSPRIIELPENYTFTPGKGAVLTDGNDAVVFGYGPVMLHEALLAAEILDKQGIHIKVVNMPWLNRPDIDWVLDAIGTCTHVWFLEDHAPQGGAGDWMLSGLTASNQIGNRRYHKLAVEDYPACGTPPEALAFHGLNGMSIAKTIQRNLDLQ